MSHSTSAISHDVCGTDEAIWFMWFSALVPLLGGVADKIVLFCFILNLSYVKGRPLSPAVALLFTRNERLTAGG
jgi:hypothetical protein